MQREQFRKYFPASKYAPVEKEFVRKLVAPEEGEQLTMAEWASSFNIIVDEYLATGEVSEVKSWMIPFLEHYRKSFQANQINLFHTKQDFGHSDNNPSYFKNRMFHALNGSMVPMWIALGAPGEPFPREIATNVQIDLALQSVALCRYRADQSSRTKAGTPAWFYSPERRMFREVFDGVINEYDVAITLIDLLKKHPELTLVPAPPRYEHNYSQNNNDFILVDRTTGDARGIQAKAGAFMHGACYDSNVISLISGVADLGSSTHLRLNPLKSKESTVTHPGLVAANFVASLPTANVRLPEGLPVTYLMQAKFNAKSILAGHKKWRQDIVNAVKRRIMEDLYRAEPSPEPSLSLLDSA